MVLTPQIEQKQAAEPASDPARPPFLQPSGRVTLPPREHRAP